jgi:hypothetical protein
MHVDPKLKIYPIFYQLTYFLPIDQYITLYIFTHIVFTPHVIKAMKGVVEEKKKEPYKCTTKGILM